MATRAAIVGLERGREKEMETGRERGSGYVADDYGDANGDNDDRGVGMRTIRRKVITLLKPHNI